MSQSETTTNAQVRPRKLRVPLNRFTLLGIAAVSVVAAAVLLSWMFIGGPLNNDDGTTGTTRSSKGISGGDGGFAAATPAPAAASWDGGPSLTVTGEDYKWLPESGVAQSREEALSAQSSYLAGLGDSRQIISQGSMSVEVPSVPAAADRIRDIAEGAGGFVEQLSSYGVKDAQQTNMTVRVPQPSFSSVFDQIKALGEVQSENTGSEDVTEQFIDLEARLKSAQREELSLLSLLDRAEKISEILIIEQELTRVRTELERLQGQLNFLERRVDLASISVFLSTPQIDEGQPPSGSLTVEPSDVSGSVTTIKALVGQVDGEIDRVYTSIQDGRQRALMTIRVFAKDFDVLVSAVESQGGLVSKEVQEGKPGEAALDGSNPKPNARLDIVFQDGESSTLGRNLAIFVPLGTFALVIVLGALFYGVYRMGVRRGD
ncbi:MAG: DUF4349 domain-containing protein [Chloroflexi bacterium]|nr:DUF4349 domain-containing protein [Chloroflexota bacterium]MDA1272375.1 DUF4349 domain-containing protein [Chloroflexota bacterium]